MTTPTSFPPPEHPPPGYPPPGQPPYGPPPGYPPYGPPPQTSSPTLLTAILAALFVAATVVVAIVVHGSDDTATATAPAVVPSGAVPGGASASYAVPSYTPPTYSPPTYSPPTSYVPSPTPTHVPLNAEAINRTFQVYMNALLNRSLSQLRSATCPRLRGTLRGTALDGKYINRYEGSSYRIYDSLDYVIIPTRVRYVDPRTGGNGGSHTYRWYVERYPDGRYWVCGITG